MANLLKPQVIKALEDGGLAPEYIEFLGWMNGNAHALNNCFAKWGAVSTVKAAHTCLASPGNIAQLQRFFQKKLDALMPDKPANHDEADRLLREHRKATRNLKPAYEEEEVSEHAPEE